MRPALKYIVKMRSRYHSARFHMRSCVNMNPRNADASTVVAVPITVRATETSVASARPPRPRTCV
ncbi:hypothetical protein [Promicromonospora soli]